MAHEQSPVNVGFLVCLFYFSIFHTKLERKRFCFCFLEGDTAVSVFCFLFCSNQLKYPQKIVYHIFAKK